MQNEKTNPGVSGKAKDGRSWVNPKEYDKQKEFMDKVDESEKGFSTQGRGQNLYGRSDLNNQSKQTSPNITEEQIVEALKRSPEADVGHVKVRLEGSVVHLEGLISDVNEMREMENIVMNIPGVSKVITHAELKNDERKAS